MTQLKALLVTDLDGGYQAAGQSWLRLEGEDIAQALRAKGHDITVVAIDRLLDTDLTGFDVAYYTSSVDAAVRHYVRDVIYVASKSIAVSPSLDLLMAHENKGMQELLRRKYGLGDLDAEYHVDPDRMETKPPFVFKTIDGAGSSGVELVRDERGWRKLVARRFRDSLDRRLRAIQRKIKLTAEQFARYRAYYKPRHPFVAQQFVEGLSGDFKILVFGDRYYTLSRTNRAGDFRASGSGNFDSGAQCPDHLLDYAQMLSRKLGAPFLSFDLADGKDGPALIEYQALNFGPSTLTMGSGFYVREGDGWSFREDRPDLAAAFVHALALDLERREAAA